MKNRAKIFEYLGEAAYARYQLSKVSGMADSELPNRYREAWLLKWKFYMNMIKLVEKSR